MMQKSKVVVRIGGREYTIKSFESEEYIHKVAIYVDKKMEQVQKCQPSLSSSMISMLTAINLADEVIKLQERNGKLQRELSALHDLLDAHDTSAAPAVYDVTRRVRR